MLAALLPLLRGAVIVLFLPLVVVMPVVYFRALRPRRGTTEWMRRLDPPKFRPIQGQTLHMADLPWGILAVLCAAAVYLIVLFFRSGWFLQDAPWLFFSQAAFYYLPRLLLSAALGAGVFLLLRGWYAHGSVGFWAAVLSPLLFHDRLAEGTALVFALWFFWLWMTAEPRACWFRRAVFLLPAGLCYGVGLVLCWPSVFLAPLFVAGYVRTLVFRWRGGVHRVRNLLLSLVLTALLCLCGVLGVWILYGFLSGTNRELGNLRRLSYYGQMLPTLLVQAKGLLVRPALQETVIYGDVFPVLLGLGTAIPLLHGLLKRRDERCLYILLLLLGLAAMWLVSGAYLLPLGLLLAFGWVWESCAARRCGGAVWGLALGLGAFLLCDTLFIILGRFA